MSKMNCRLTFFGNERLATGTTSKLPILRSLVSSGYQVAAIVLSQDEIRSRNNKLPEVVAFANDNKIPVLDLDDTGIIKQITALNTEIGVLVAYGKIVPQEMIDIFPHGIINIHPSLLPIYRGPTPVETAILDGANLTGVSIMNLVREMDAGPIYKQSSMKLGNNPSKQELADGLAKLGSDLLIDCLPDILSGSLKPVSQNDASATYTRLLTKDDGLVDWAESADTIERKVRAYHGWPKSRAIVGKHQIIITKSRVANSKADGALVMVCGSGFLEILELTAPSGRQISGADFLRGYSG